MDPGGTAHLRDAANGFFNFLRGHEHQVGQLVDDHDNLRHFLLLGVVGDRAVVGSQIAHAGLGHQAIAAHHFRDRPLQRTGGLLRVGNNGNKKMRDAVINAQLDHLRIDHNEAHFLGLGLVQKRNNQRVHAHGLARAGRTGNEHMRQLGNVAHDAVAADVLADGEGQLGLTCLECGRVDDLACKDGVDDLVRHLDANHGNLVRNG